MEIINRLALINENLIESQPAFSEGVFLDNFDIRFEAMLFFNFFMEEYAIGYEGGEFKNCNAGGVYFLAPDKPYHVVIQNNGFNETVNADSLGLIMTISCYNRLCWFAHDKGKFEISKKYEEKYQELLHFIHTKKAGVDTLQIRRALD